MIHKFVMNWALHLDRTMVSAYTTSHSYFMKCQFLSTCLGIMWWKPECSFLTQACLFWWKLNSTWKWITIYRIVTVKGKHSMLSEYTDLTNPGEWWLEDNCGEMPFGLNFKGWSVINKRRFWWFQDLRTRIPDLLENGKWFYAEIWKDRWSWPDIVEADNIRQKNN